MENKPLISIVSPVYGAEKIVDELVSQIKEWTGKITQYYEIILVDDRGPDDSWKKIEANAKRDPRVIGVQLSKNFGQHAAITAGIASAKGDYCIVMDCDLQDNPSYIPELVKLVDEGYDYVLTIKESRQHSGFKNITAKLFTKLFNFLIANPDQNSSDQIGSYSIMNRDVINAYLSISEAHRHYLMVLRWVGFKRGYLKVKHDERHSGNSGYNLLKLLEHAINGIVGQSNRLLEFSVYIGLLFFFMSLTGGAGIIFSYFLSGFKSGWASIFILILFSSGLVLLNMGILGLYIGKIFTQTKQRPLFIIKKKINGS